MSKWWFWAGVVAVVGGGVAIGVVASGGGDGKNFNNPPSNLPIPPGNILRF